MDADPVPDGDPLSSSAGDAPVTAAAALGAADAATRIGGRRHPVLPAAVLSGFAVRAVELAAVIDRGCLGNPDRPLIQALAGDLSRGLDRACTCAPGRQLRLDVIMRSGPAPVSTLASALGRASERSSAARDYTAALELAHGLARAAGEVLAPGLDRRLNLSRDQDLELACELADGLDRDLARAIAAAGGPAASGTTDDLLDLACERSRALERVCVAGAAGRLGILAAKGLAEALLDGAADDFTSADLTRASLAGTDLTGMRWSLSGTTWPPGTNVKALLARSEHAGPGGALVITRRGMVWPP